MRFELKKLTINDGRDVYEMLQEMPEDENGFENHVHGKTFEEYQKWLIRRDAESRGEGLKEGKVPQTTYWLFVDGRPVGFGKLRHYLTEKLREEGGHAGYAIRPSERNKGYGAVLLKMLIEEAGKLNIDRVLLTIRNHNTHSLKVALNNKGKIEKADEIRHYIWIDCKLV